tara:strand:+ start:434 stop:1117 length:684 start_codon:yes stop_codon:yes gene_type:complete
MFLIQRRFKRLKKIVPYFVIEFKIIFIIICAEIYNSISVSNHIRNFFVEKFLDSSCKRIAKLLEKKIRSEYFFLKNNEIILVSRLQKGGGLTDIYNKINFSHRSLTLATNIFDFRSTTHLKIKGGQNIKQFNNFGSIARIKKILNYISNESLKIIHILNDNTDPLIYISYLISNQNRKKFIFYHHADHSFCFGSFEKDWRHIDLFQNQFLSCKKELEPDFISMIDFL